MTRWINVYVSVNDLNTVMNVLTSTTLYLDDAKALCQRALKAAQSSGISGDKILACRMYGLYYFTIGRSDEARQYFSRAIGGSGCRRCETRQIKALALKPEAATYIRNLEQQLQPAAASVNGTTATARPERCILCELARRLHILPL